MRMNRSSMVVVFALGCALSACGGSADDNVNDSQESLRRGQAADGGAFGGRRGDRDDDSDESGDEDRSGDGGRRHGRGKYEGLAGDGGCDVFHGGFGNRGRGGKDGDDRDDERGPKHHGDAGVRGGKRGQLDGGAP